MSSQPAKKCVLSIALGANRYRPDPSHTRRPATSAGTHTECANGLGALGYLLSWESPGGRGSGSRPRLRGGSLSSGMTGGDWSGAQDFAIVLVSQQGCLGRAILARVVQLRGRSTRIHDPDGNVIELVQHPLGLKNSKGEAVEVPHDPNGLIWARLPGYGPSI